MPKFLTYQRPAPVNKGNWNTAPERKPQRPEKAKLPDRPENRPILPPLEQLLRKD